MDPKEEKNFISLPLSERQARLIAESFRDLHDRLKGLGNAEDLADSEKILKSADRVMRALAPIFRFQHDIPRVNFSHDGHEWVGSMTDLLAGGGLCWLASEVRRFKPSRGQPAKALLAACAQAIREVVRSETGRRLKWQRVGEIVAETFPEALPQERHTREDVRSLARWITQIVFRNVTSKWKGLRGGAKSISSARATTSDFLPRTKAKPQRSPEYLLAYVEALNKLLGGKDLRPKQKQAR